MSAEPVDHALISSPIGLIAFRLNQDGDVDIDLNVAENTAEASEREPSSDSLVSAVQQVRAFFADPHYRFDGALKQRGTAFQQRVWDALSAIPSGQVKTYKSLAEQLGTSPRAIGNACRANHLPILVPCHRAVAVNGLGGFMGATQARDPAALNIKRWLLEFEQAPI